MFIPLHLSESYQTKRPNWYELVGKENKISGHKPETSAKTEGRGRERRKKIGLEDIFVNFRKCPLGRAHDG